VVGPPEAERDIGELTGRTDVDGVVEEVEQPSGRAHVGAAERDLAGGADQGEVACQDPSGEAEGGTVLQGGLARNGPCGEGPRDVDCAPPDEVTVDHVVVDDERRMEQLEPHGHAPRHLVVAAPVGVIGRSHQRRSEPLAGCCRPTERSPELEIVLSVVRRLLQPLRHEAVELILKTHAPTSWCDDDIRASQDNGIRDRTASDQGPGRPQRARATG